MEKRSLSWQEFLDSGFDGLDYNFPDFEGTFEAEMVCKRWDKNSKLLVYKTDTDGHTDVFVRAEDASKINRIFERFGIATILTTRPWTAGM